MPVVDPRIAGKPVPRISKETMERDNVARAQTVKGSDLAFLDQRIPAYQREIIDMVGMGVTENAALRPNVKAGAHGFSITYVRAPKGKGAALHRHATEEVFIPVQGALAGVLAGRRGGAHASISTSGDVVQRADRHLRRLPQFRRPARRAADGDHRRSRRRQGRLASLGARTKRASTGLSVDDDGNLIVEKPAA